MSVDIAFLNNVLGEDYNRDWYYLCDLKKSCLQLKGHDTRCRWTIESLCEQAKDVSEGNLIGTNCKGVREEQYFKIPIERVMILHTLIGIDNQVIENLWILLTMTLRSNVQKKFVSEINLEILMKIYVQVSRRKGDVGQCIRSWNWNIERIQEGEKQQ